MVQIYESMKLKILAPTAFAYLVLSTAGAGTQAEEVAEFIAKLGSDSFQEREKATAELWQLGQPARLALEKASKSEDPETALRAAEVLEKVELRITPETEAEILAAVQRYQDAAIEDKVDLLGELRSRRAYFQILKLYASEEEPETKIRLLPVIRGVGIAGARVAITEDDSATAEELLKMTAMEPMDMMALACLYRNLGLLKDGLELPEAPTNVPDGLWEITLLRAKGDIKGAIEVASKVRRSQQLAGLTVLAGDPTLWLRQNGMADRKMAALDSYVELALKRWDGEMLRDADLAPLKALAKSDESDERNRALVSLAALGHPEFAERELAEESPTLAFLHYLSSERIDEGFAVLGINPENPDYKTWVGERFSTLLAAEDDNGRRADEASTELLLLANFMELRGLDEEYEAAFSEPLAELAKEREETFINYLRFQLEGRSGAPGFAVAHASQWAGEDKNRWTEMFRTAFGDERIVTEWIGWISEIEPDIDPADRMRAAMALFGIGVDNGDLSEEWMNKLWANVEAKEEDEKEPFIRKLMLLAISRQDVANALKARDMLDPDSRATTLWPDIDKYMSAADRWSDAAEILRKNTSAVSTSPEYHARTAATLRMAGFEKEAAVHDEWADKLALGQASVCNRMGDHYVYGEDSANAIKWYRRAAFQADMAGSDFTNSLGDYAQAMMDEGSWKIAASCFEALVQVDMSNRVSLRSLQIYTKARLSADLARALSLVGEDRELAISMLADMHRIFITDGVLADDFFPMLKKAGLEKEMEDFFMKSWAKLKPVIEKYPKSTNTLNTAGWLAGRACLKLEEAERYMKIAVGKNPKQAAYLDTMAEVQFAKGDRKAAVRWSSKAISSYPLTDPPADVMIRKQHGRFKNAPLPVK